MPNNLTCIKCGKKAGFRTKDKRARTYICRNCGAEQLVIFVNGVAEIKEDKGEVAEPNK